MGDLRVASTSAASTSESDNPGNNPGGNFADWDFRSMPSAANAGGIKTEREGRKNYRFPAVSGKRRSGPRRDAQSAL